MADILDKIQKCVDEIQNASYDSEEYERGVELALAIIHNMLGFVPTKSESKKEYSRRNILVYVAGPYNAPEVLSVFGNMRNGIDFAMELGCLGYTVYCPWLDYQFAIRRNLPIDFFKEQAMEILRRSDCIFLLHGWENSPGVQKELQEANRLDIPRFERFDDLGTWARDCLSKENWRGKIMYKRREK